MIDRNKIIIGGIGIAALFFIFFFILLSAFFPKKNIDETTGEPTQAVVVVPTTSTIDGVEEENSSNPNSLILLTVEPPDGTIGQSPITQVAMTFNQPVNEKTFYYKVDPETPSFIHTDGNKVIISPESIWRDGKVTITVFQEVQSQSGQSLSAPFSYSFNVEDLPFPDEEIE